jgi:branched-chain amino acid transport system permease protein
MALLAIGVIIITLPLSQPVDLRIVTLTLLWAAAGAAYNLTAKAGQISLGHSAFTGIGAYAFVLLLEHGGVSPWLGMLAGMAAGALAAVIIGVPSLRLRGFYFTLGTMAYPLTLMLIVIYLGIGETTLPFHVDEPWLYMQFRDQHNYVWIALGLLIIVQVIVIAVERGRFGYYLRAIRDNEVVAQAVGVRTARWKVAAFALSGALTAAMAVVWVNAVLLVVSAHQIFGLAVVIQTMSVVFVGGLATRWGPIVGAALLVPVASILEHNVGDRVPGIQALVYGLALVAVALLAPDGIVPRFNAWRARRRGEHSETVAAAEPCTALAPAPVAPPVAPTTATDGALLEASAISKAFGGLQALDDVAIQVRRGAIVGIIGTNGAGKTTLFNVLTGLYRPDAGAVRLAGVDITRMAPQDRYRHGLSRTFQVPQGFSRMTPRENVLVAAMTVYDAGDREAMVTWALEAVGLGAKRDAELSTLSTLEFKFLEIARAIVSQPSVLLVDEPLAGLSASERTRVIDLLRAITQTGTTVVIIEHSVRTLAAFVDEIVALDRGRVIAAGTPAEVIADQAVVESYLGRSFASDAARI